VTLDIIDAPEAPIPDASLVCVTFTLKLRALVFLASVQSGTNGSVMMQSLTCRLPKQIAGAEVRRAFRIPVLGPVGLEGRINASGRWYEVSRVRDISKHGIGITFAKPDEGPGLEPDAVIAAELRIEGLRQLIRGSVRSRCDGDYGIFFPESGESGKGTSSDEFRAIVQRIEQYWLQHRYDDDAPEEAA